jgi:hypothetical protein
MLLELRNRLCQLMDAQRHHCRTNSYHTDHVAIGLRTHKVIDIKHINCDDNSCTEHHEALGFDHMYNNFDLSNIKIAHHVQNRNMTINKRLCERKQDQEIKRSLALCLHNNSLGLKKLVNVPEKPSVKRGIQNCPTKALLFGSKFI